MSPVCARDVDRAVAEMLRVLVPHQDRDWRIPAGSLDWTCRETAAHVAHDLLAYAGQVAGGPTDAYLPLDLTVREDAPVADVLRVVAACGALLVRALDAAGPDDRAWHWGPTDPSGFAALGVNETLVHTYDIAQGLGVAWLPPAPLCAAVLDRLFPDSPAGDPSRVLLWCTGRGALAGLPRRTSWVARAARG
jgi:uncharacterized protein (TIGR03083 family)